MTEPAPPPTSTRPPAGAAETHFFELAGERAAGRLRALAADLPGDVSGELLASRDQPDLHLLVCRGGAAALATVATPDGARRWRFAAPAADAGVR